MKKHLFFLILISLAIAITNTACDDINNAKITKVVIKGFPTTKPSGAAWDPNKTSADPFIRITSPSGTKEYHESKYINGGNPNAEHVFALSTDDANFFLGTYKLSLLDADAPDKSVSELIGDLPFTISDDKKNRVINLNTLGITAEIHVDYIK